MSLRSKRLAVSLFALLVPLAAFAGDEKLATGYAAILRGDVAAGRVAMRDAAATDQPVNLEIARVNGWLDQFEKILVERDDLLRRTFEWNVERSKASLAEGKEFLALNFAAQAASYAGDLDAFGNETWVKELAAKAKVAAREQEKQDQWTKALSYYYLLGAIYKDNEEIKALRDEAIRHARITVAYKDKAALDERLAGVEARMLKETIENVRRGYYRTPDFKKMADGALNNLTTLATATKMQGILDGLANQTPQAHFLKKLAEFRSELQAADSFSARNLVELYEKIQRENKASVTMPEALIIAEFVEGALSSLDEFTSMIWPADAKDFEKMMEGSFQGVGIQLGIDEATSSLKVVTPLEDSPALEAGVQPDDLIVKVDGRSTKGWTTEDAVKNIMGPAGSKVELTMRRPSTGMDLVFPLERRKIVLRTVRGLDRIPGEADKWNYMLDPENGIAYVRLSGFHPDSAQELQRALSEARDQGMRGLVLDLRFNPGGMLDVAIDVVGTFLKSGEVVSTRGRLEEEQHVDVEGRAKFGDLPLVVLVNDNSASASEILSGALQDHNRAVVLGDRTYGKGSVQRVLPLRPAAGDKPVRLKMTTALYYLPSGRSPHKALNTRMWGVDPDWKLALTPKESRKILERERDTSIIRRADAPPKKEPEAKPVNSVSIEDKLDEEEDEDGPPLLSVEDIKALSADPHKAPDVDPQLQAALLQMRVKLAANLPWPRQVAAAASNDGADKR